MSSSSGPGATGPLVGSTDYADYRDPTEMPSVIPRFHDNGMPCVIFTSNILLNFGLQIALGMVKDARVDAVALDSPFYSSRST